MKALINYLPMLTELSGLLLTSHNGDVEKQQLRTTIQQYIIHKHTKTKITGADRMEKIISLATSLPGYELSYFQRRCMDAILSIISPIVFKGESAQDISDYFRKTGRVLSKSRMVLLTTSRRSGKTDLLTIIAAVLLITVPNIEMLCWSLYNETSALFGGQMEKWIIDMGYRSQIQKSESHIIFKSGYDDDRRSIVFMGSQNPNVSASFSFPLCMFMCRLWGGGKNNEQYIFVTKTTKQQKKVNMWCCLMSFIIVLGACGVSCTILASDSDMGKTTLIASGSDAFLYFVDDLTMINKLHWVVSVPDCSCIGAVDIQKIYQIDYMLFTEFVFSFGTYVNDGKFHDRVPCTLLTEDIQKKTSLSFNQIGSISANDTAFRHSHFNSRFEGIVIAQGIRDFREHSHVKKHSKELYGTDKSGGFLFTQGTVFMRPCMLWPWYIPWILDSYEDEYHLFKYTLPFEEVRGMPYFDAADAELFNSIVDKMKADNVITQKHIDNIGDNNGAVFYTKSFSFQAIFIPHRFTAEFLRLITPFSTTRLSPYVYVPFVYQLMWDKNEWAHMKYNNNTLMASPEGLLQRCDAHTVADTMKDVNDRQAMSMYYFAYYCGSYVDIAYIMHNAKNYVLLNLYKVTFYLVVSIVALCIFLRYMRTCCSVLGKVCAGLKACVRRLCPCFVGYKRLKYNPGDFGHDSNVVSDTEMDDIYDHPSLQADDNKDGSLDI